MSASIHHLKPRQDPVQQRAQQQLTDPNAIALNRLGQLAKSACFLAARGYQIKGTSTGLGRVYLSDGHFLRRQDGASVVIQHRPGIFADLSGESVGSYTAADGSTKRVWRTTNPAWPDVAIYWTSEEDHPKCA